MEFIVSALIGFSAIFVLVPVAYLLQRRLDREDKEQHPAKRTA